MAVESNHPEQPDAPVEQPQVEMEDIPPQEPNEPNESNEPAGKELSVTDSTEGTGEVVGEERDRWSSRAVFILGAIGSAVGLGNFWRFPILVHKYGGGPFLIPYWVSLFAFGIPMLLLELSIGQKFQSGDVAAFGTIHPKLRGVGYASVFASWLVITFYMVVIAWTGLYFVESFYMPWGGSRDWIDGKIGCIEASASKAQYHFYHDTLQFWDNNCTAVGTGMDDTSTVSGRAVGALVVSWVMVAGSVLFGVKSASVVVKITMPMPFILAVVLFIRAMTLEGAGDGVKAYIGGWDFSEIRKPEIWTDAVGQIFFTLSVCFGVMTSYGSYRPRNRPVVANVFIIALANCTFSFFCGFIVFGMLGNMAKVATDDCREVNCPSSLPPADLEKCNTGCTRDVDSVVDGGFGLVFQIFPHVLASMGTSGYVFSVCTFMTLFTLGWDSGFSLLEAITTVVLDAPFGQSNVKAALQAKVGATWATPLVTVCVALSAFLAGLLFTADIGLRWLDLVDHYSNNYVMLIDGVLQAVAVGWVWGIPTMTRKVGRSSALWFTMSSVVGGVLFIVFTASLAIETAPCDPKVEGQPLQCYTGGELALGFLLLALFFVVGWAKSFLASGQPVGVWFKAVVLAGTEELWEFISIVSQTKGTPMGEGTRLIDFAGAFFRLWWMFMIKYVTPIVLSFLVVLTFKNDVRDNYGGHPDWMQNVMWICVISVAMFVFLIFTFLPGEFGEPEGNPDPVELYKEEMQGEQAAKEEVNNEPSTEEA